jgi:hypothetical protein
VEPLTFTINELAAALQLIRDQDGELILILFLDTRDLLIYTELFRAHENSTAEAPSPQTSGCPACIFRAHRQQCYACHVNIPKESYGPEPKPAGELFALRYALILTFHFSRQYAK